MKIQRSIERLARRIEQAERHLWGVGDVAAELAELALPHIEAKDWDGVISAFGRNWGLDVFSIIHPELSDAHYWRALAEVWEMMERPGRAASRFKRFLASPRPQREQMMTERDRITLAAMPSVIHVFRGSSGRRQWATGWSWTIDRERAEWFATRLPRFSRTPLLTIGVVAKDDVFAYFGKPPDHRGEDEIVADPAKVRVIEIAPARGPSVRWLEAARHTACEPPS